MYQQNDKFHLPETVEEAVDLIVSDLLVNHADTFISLTEQQFDLLYKEASPYILSEFKLWSGNDKLLNACMDQIGETEPNDDPAGLILRRARERLEETQGLLIIT